VNLTPARDLLGRLAQIPDPRGRQGRRHPLSAMLASLVCALLSGQRNLSAIVQWLHAQEVAVWHLLGFNRTPPKDHAFRDLLAALSPECLEQAIADWVQDCHPETTAELTAVAIDGKKLCGTLSKHAAMVHLLAVFSHETGCVLGECEVSGETNEFKASLPLIEKLICKGQVVTGDAMFCQREFCQKVVDREGHYLLSVKENQPSLLEAVSAEFQAGFSPLQRAAT